MTFNQRLFISSVGSSKLTWSSFFPELAKKEERGEEALSPFVLPEITELYSVLLLSLSWDVTLSEMIFVTSLFYFFTSDVSVPAMVIIWVLLLFTDWFLRMRAIWLLEFFAPKRFCDFYLWCYMIAGRLGFVLPRVIFAAPGVTVGSRQVGRFT